MIKVSTLWKSKFIELIKFEEYRDQVCDLHHYEEGRHDPLICVKS
jgi:hypothetical protein